MKKILLVVLILTMFASAQIFRPSEGGTQQPKIEYLQGGILLRFDFRQIEQIDMDGNKSIMWKYQEFWIPLDMSEVEIQRVIGIKGYKLGTDDIKKLTHLEGNQTSIDTARYLRYLQRQVANADEAQMALIQDEILTLAGLDSAEIDEMEKSGDFPTTEVIGGTALLAIYALLRKKKSGKVPTAQELIVDYFGKMPEDSKIDVQQLYRALTPIETSSVWRNSTIKLWLEFNGVHFYKSWTKAKLLKAVTDYVELENG